MDARVVLIVCFIGFAALLGGAFSFGEVSAASSLSAESEDPIDADETRINIEVKEDGSAEWVIEFWVELDDQDTRDAFDSLQTDVESDPDSYTQPFADRIDETVHAASETTDREMHAEDFAVTTEQQTLAGEYGVVRYSFQWQAFSLVDEDDLHIGDAIDGFYLDDTTRLLISWPDGYEQVVVTPEPDDERDNGVIWFGSETEFVSEEPRVVVSPTTSIPLAAYAGVVFAFIAVLSGLVVLWNRRSSKGDGGESPSKDGVKEVPSQSDTTSVDAGEEELMSNEEKVLHLLEENGGRMKQQQVVEELGWTDAKTSKVVSTLRDDGDIESFRIGRENVLTSPDENNLD